MISPILVNLYIVFFISLAPASVYGWRYILFSAIPVTIIFFSNLLNKINMNKHILIILIFTSIIPLFGMINFLFFPIELTNSEFENFRTYRNPNYFYDLIKLMISNPIMIFIKNPFSIFNKNILIFQTFEVSQIIKIIINYTFPFVLLLFNHLDSKLSYNQYAKQ
jgi:hypothetical protein